jgi:hypothetical protein
MQIISAILGIFSNDDEPTGPTGADAIRTAVQEFQDLAEQEFTATLGEPDVIEQGGEFFNDPKVVVPINDGPFGEDQRLVFDLPRGEDYEMEQFNQLLRLFGLTFDTMEELAGEEAPVRFAAGNLVVDWDAMDEPDDYWEEELTEDEVEDDSEEDTEKVADESDSGVNIEETTISAEGDDD